MSERHPNWSRMEHGNLLHPKIITVAVRGFLSLIWMVNFQLELLADAGRGNTGVHQAAVWGVAACLSPFLHWRIENFQDNVKFGSGKKKNSSYLHFWSEPNLGLW